MNTIQLFMLGIMFMIIFIGIVLCFTTIKKTKKINVVPMLKQFCFIVTVGSVFNLAAACSEVVLAKPTMLIYMLWLLNIVLILFCVLNRKKRRISVRKLRKKLFQHKYISIVLIFSAVIRIILFQNITMQRWDAGQYYYALGTACENYHFTLKSAWASFRLVNHSTLGFSLLMGIGEFLNPRGVQGVLCVNLVLTIMALYCMYELMRKYCAHFNDRQAAIGTLLVSVAPLFLGTCGYVNVDYVLALAFIFMIYCEYKKWNLLLFFWGVVLVQTKETGLFVFVGYFVGHFIYWMLKKQGSIFQRFISVFHERVTWATMGVAFSYAFYAFELGAFTAWEQTAGAGSKVFWSNTEMNCFGFQPDNIHVKSLHFFVLNFAWVLLALLLVLLTLAIIKKKKLKSCATNMQGIWGGIGVFVVFSFLYVTWDIERYNILFVVLFVFILYVFCENICIQLRITRKKRTVTWGAIAVLFFIQTFVPLDFVSNLSFKTVDTGTTKMLYTSKSSDYFGDFLVNNYQYVWLDKAIDMVFEEIEYNQDILILISGSQYAGIHVNGNTVAYPVFWDMKINRRVMYENEHTCPINITGDFVATEDTPDNLVAIFVPYYEIDEDAILNNYREFYEISPRKTAKCFGGAINYYYLSKAERE